MRIWIFGAAFPQSRSCPWTTTAYISSLGRSLCFQGTRIRSKSASIWGKFLGVNFNCCPYYGKISNKGKHFQKKFIFVKCHKHKKGGFSYLKTACVEICLKIEVYFSSCLLLQVKRIFCHGKAKVVLLWQKAIKYDVLCMEIGVETYLKFEGDFWSVWFLFHCERPLSSILGQRPCRILA